MTMPNVHKLVKMNKPLVIVQARTGSTRLPNKMLIPFHNNESVLQIILSRLLTALGHHADRLVVATTVCDSDKGIVDLCNNIGVKVFRGNEHDVLDRFIQAAHTYSADRIIRVCADNVFLDMASFLYLYDLMTSTQADYESFRTLDGTPSIRTHYGFWTEGVTTSALEKVASMTDEPIYHEHVTNFIYTNPDTFKVSLTPVQQLIPEVELHRDLRLTLDTADDFKIQQQLYAYLHDNGLDITPSEIFRYLDANPELYCVMKKNIEANSK